MTVKQKRLNLVGQAYLALCETVDTPISLGAWLRYEYEEHLDLANLSIRPEWYSDAYSFHQDYSCVVYLQKSVELTTGVDLPGEAISAFRAAEKQCGETNRRLRDFARLGGEPKIEQILHLARRKIAQILGRLDVNLVLRHCRWGQGASYDLSRRMSSPAQKNSTVLTTTPAGLPYIRALVEAHPIWMESLFGAPSGKHHRQKLHAEIVGPYRCLPSCFDMVEGNRVTTVPKNAKTDRTIAMEPTANGFLQQGAGRYLRYRLKRHGVDLGDQEVNQTWASYAHLLDLATLDLKAASDTISRELVYHLLPLDWANFLDSIRSPFFEDDGVWTRYQKFSSMGNAFTFELESMIFYALCSSVADVERPRSPVSVYGDDIIVAQEIVPTVIQVLNFCGFVINTTKSFWKGSFYESCGKHYFEGHDVTPVYQKEELSSDRLDSLVRGANRLFRLACRLGCDWAPHRASMQARGVLLRASGKAAQHFVKPPSPGDDAFDYPLDHKLIRRLASRSSGFGLSVRCNVFRRKTVNKTSNRLGYYAILLQQNHAEDTGSSPSVTAWQVPALMVRTGRLPFVRAFLRRRWCTVFAGQVETSPTWGGITGTFEHDDLLERKRWVTPAG